MHVSSGRRRFVHIGLPKTGTTYLQGILAAERDSLRQVGLLYPGARTDHFLPVQDVLERPFLRRPDPRVEGTWQRLLDEILAWPGDVLISHELLAGARGEVIDEIVGELGRDDVVVLVTARDLARQVPAVWQERIKNGAVHSLQNYLQRVESARHAADRGSRIFWRLQDLPRIIQRWGERVGMDHVVVVTVPAPDGAGEPLAARFARAIGVAPTLLTSADGNATRVNASLGIAETEFLRRLNVEVSSELPWPEYRRLVKKHLAEHRLAGRSGARRLALPPQASAWVEDEAADMIEHVAALGARVVGSLEDLRPRAVGHYAPPTAAELALVASHASAALVQDAEALIGGPLTGDDDEAEDMADLARERWGSLLGSGREDAL
jgi:hypothetical protein